MFKSFGILILNLLLCGPLYALDGFESVKCDANIPQAILGKRPSNLDEHVVDIEQRHKDIGLKDLGSSEISDRLYAISWLICGKEFMLIVNSHDGLVRDVLPFPPHSKASPAFEGYCTLKGEKMPDDIIAILDDPAGNSKPYRLDDTKLLPAKVAWKIDVKNAKFIQIPAEGLQCSRNGVITADGGP